MIEYPLEVLLSVTPLGTDAIAMVNEVKENKMIKSADNFFITSPKIIYKNRIKFAEEETPDKSRG